MFPDPQLQQIKLALDKSYLAPPAPVVKFCPQDISLAFPTPDNDGSYIYAPADGASSLVRKTKTNTTVWTVSPGSLGAYDSWACAPWLDTVDNAVWIWAFLSSSYQYCLAKVSLSAGTVTTMGVCAPGNNLYLSSYMCNSRMIRGTMGSGNLTIASGGNVITISSAGQIVTASAQYAQNGVTPPAAGYLTADGALLVTYGSVAASASDGAAYIRIMRGGVAALVVYPVTIGSHFRTAASNYYVWGDCVVFGAVGNNGGTVYGPRFFDRVVLDAWLHRLADSAGLPS